MHLTAHSAPSGFSWLSATDRPTRDEIRRYAELIASREGAPREHTEALQREAELQLWVWRSETRQRPTKLKRRSRPAA